MTLIVCIDENGGMMFNRRRQSRDREIYRRITETIPAALWVSPYSAPLFEGNDRLCVDADYAEKADFSDACFVEDGELALDKADRLILYRWNRRYPADRRFPGAPEDHGFHLKASCDFIGHSHDRLTEELYEKG